MDQDRTTAHLSAKALKIVEGFQEFTLRKEFMNCSPNYKLLLYFAEVIDKLPFIRMLGPEAFKTEEGKKPEVEYVLEYNSDPTKTDIVKKHFSRIFDNPVREIADIPLQFLYALKYLHLDDIVEEPPYGCGNFRLTFHVIEGGNKEEVYEGLKTFNHK